MAEYIDRNRLKSELLILKDKIEPNTQWQDGYISAMDVARMEVGFQPSVDVVERSKINKAIEELRKEIEDNHLNVIDYADGEWITKDFIYGAIDRLKEKITLDK